MNRSTLRRSAAALLVSAPLLGCALLTADLFQTLTLFFRLTEAIEAGENVEVHTSFFPGAVEVKKDFLVIFGELTLPDGGDLPSQARVRLEAEDLAIEKVYYRLALNLSVDPDGSFHGFKKIRKDLRERTLLSAFLELTGADLPEGTEIALCVDVVPKKRDARERQPCRVDGDEPPPSGGDFVIVDVRDFEFSPKRLTIQPGQTVRWVLRGNDLTHTTSEMDGTWDSGFVFNQQGAFFERTFPQSEDGETFRYYCRTHRTCCEMQGSVLVGEDAPDPGDRY